MNQQECLLWLASQERDGSVLFPTLRKPFPEFTNSPLDEDLVMQALTDDEALDRGWVVAEVHLEDLFVLCSNMNLEVSVASVNPDTDSETYQTGHRFEAWVQRLGEFGTSGSYCGLAIDPEEALLRALVAARRAQEERK